MLIKIPLNKIKKLSEEYLSGKKSEELAKEYGVGSTTILKTLRKHAVVTKTPNEARRKYPVNHDFFDKIDTQEKAYFLGYLFADGCNCGKYINFNISEKDLNMLERLNKLVHPGGRPLYKSNARDSTFRYNGQIAHTKTNYTLSIYSAHMADALSSYGCTPRKTNTLVFPVEILSNEMLPHFVRGYFDGDGCISTYGRRDAYTQGYVSIVSTRSFCNTIAEIIKNTLDVKSKILKKKYQAENVVEFRITNTKSVIKFLEWIYKDSTIHLERKYSRYKDLLKNREYLSIIKVCCICGKEHYGKGYCNKHYQDYVRKVTALIRAKKSLFAYLELSKTENPEKCIHDIITVPFSYKIRYRPRSKR
jgi:hypothetical protein